MAHRAKGLLVGVGIAGVLGWLRAPAASTLDPDGQPCVALPKHLQAPSGDVLAESGCAAPFERLSLSFQGDELLSLHASAPDPAVAACWEQFVGERASTWRPAAATVAPRSSQCHFEWKDRGMYAKSASFTLDVGDVGPVSPRSHGCDCGGGGVAY